MTSFSIENAKSGRSSCKKCKEKIGKDELRIGKSVEVDDHIQTSWTHTRCFKLTKNQIKEGLTPESFVVDLLEDNSTAQLLSNDDERQKIIDAMSVSAQKTPKKSKGEDSSDSLYGRLSKIRKERDNDDEGGASKAKKPKLSKMENEQLEIMTNIEESYKRVDELKDVCKWNNQHVSGSKKMLMARLIDGQMYGRLGRCPLCTQGRLQLKDEKADEAICKGYYDEEKSFRVDCGNTIPVKEAPRLHPWYMTEPTEDEKAEMKRADELAKTGVDASANKQTLDVYSKAASDKLEWDKVSDASNLKQAAKELVVVLRSVSDSPMKLDLPEGESAAVKKVGPILATNRSKTVSEILDVLATELGFSEQKAKAEERKSNAMKSACKHPGNSDLLAAMSELRDLYFQQGNRNAGASYAKVCKAIAELNFEITAKNAKGLGKGKTKVANIGKSSAEKMYEFAATGKIAKLEEKRAEVAD